MCKFRALALIVAITTLSLFAWVPLATAADSEPLRILLTNDDGYNAPGIRAVHEKLLAAGHTVTLVAPLVDQSGSGARITSRGKINYHEHASDIWSVDGSPADSVLVGLNVILDADERPDIVISGANFGQNLGYGSISGTVGAATVAMYTGVPAIAVSVGIIPGERSATPVPFPSTLIAFQGAADLVINILDDLVDSRIADEILLPEHTILNVNYPAISPAELKGIQLTQAARGNGGIEVGYEESDQAGELQVRLRFNPVDSTAGNENDVVSFADGYATISVLDGDWDAGELSRAEITRRLSVISMQ